MLEFRKLTDGDIPAVEEGFRKYHSISSDCTTGVIFIWRDFFDTQVSFDFDEPVFMHTFEGRTCFPFPQSGEYAEICRALEEYCGSAGIPLCFIDVLESDFEKLEEVFGGFRASEIEIWADYVYDSEAVLELKGKKYNTQRNHINKFLRNYPDYRFEDLGGENIPACIEFLKSNRNEKESEYAETEYENALKILENYDRFSFTGSALFVGDRLAGFTCGETVGNCLTIQIEKADTYFDGVYPMLANLFLKEKLLPGTVYVNREDDAGDEGLRKSKMSLRPAFLLKKYFVEI